MSYDTITSPPSLIPTSCVETQFTLGQIRISRAASLRCTQMKLDLRFIVKRHQRHDYGVVSPSTIDDNTHALLTGSGVVMSAYLLTGDDDLLWVITDITPSASKTRIVLGGEL